ACAPRGLAARRDRGRGGGAGGGGAPRRWLETFLGLAPARTAVRARGLLALAHFLRWEHAFPRAAGAAREARALFAALGDADGVAEAASHEGQHAATLRDYAPRRAPPPPPPPP